VGLLALGTSSAKAFVTIRLGGFVNLVARGFAAAAGSAHATGKLGLTAAGQAIAMARGAPGGAVGLLARTVAASKASASIRIGAFVNLVARGFAAAAGSARATGKLALIATGKGTAAATAAPAGAVGFLARTIATSKAAAAGTWRLALSARGSGAAKSFASTRGIVGLLARGAAAAMANARIGTGVGNFVHLLARGFAAAAGAAHATGKVGLVASSNAAAAGQAAPGGAVGLLAFTAAASKALAFLAPVLDLRLVRFLTGRASAGTIDGKEGAALHPRSAFTCGDTFPIYACLHYADGSPFNLGAGAVIEWEMQDCDGNVVLELTLAGGGIIVTDPGDTPPNKCLITITALQSAAIMPGKYKDQLRAIDPSGFVSTQAVGSIEVRKSFFTS
jgi:hypothetical protein